MLNYLFCHEILQSNIRNKLIFIYSYSLKFRNFTVFLKIPMSCDRNSNAKPGKKKIAKIALDVLKTLK